MLSSLFNNEYSEITTLNCASPNYNPEEEWFMKIKDQTDDNYTLLLVGNLYDELKDYDSAITWYTKSSNLGNYIAQTNIGIIYQDILEDYDSALQWYLKAIENGFIEAKYNIATLYEDLNEFSLSKKWYEESATDGHVMSQHHLGLLYHHVLSDTAASLVWLEKSYRNGYIPSAHAIGAIYEEFKEYDTARYWFAQSANKGFVPSMRFMGYTCSEHVESEEECCICMESIHANRKLTCGHIICEHCLYMIIMTSPKCPLCRTEIK